MSGTIRTRFLAILAFLALGQSVHGRLEYVQHNSGNYEAKLYIDISEPLVDWVAVFNFEFEISDFMVCITCGIFIYFCLDNEI